MTHICVGKLNIIGSDNGLSPGRRQAIIWTNAGILLIWPFGTNFSEFSIDIQTFSFMKMYLQVSSAKWRPFCLGLNVLIYVNQTLIFGLEVKIWSGKHFVTIHFQAAILHRNFHTCHMSTDMHKLFYWPFVRLGTRSKEYTKAYSAHHCFMT